MVDLGVLVKYHLSAFFARTQTFRGPKGDAVDSLTTKWSVLIYCFIIGVCVTHFFWGSGQISCWLEHQYLNQIWKEFVNNYCYVQGTYYTTPAIRVWGKFGRVENKDIHFYQWVPYFLATQAVMLYLPSLIWNKVLMKRYLGFDLGLINKYFDQKIWKDNEDGFESLRTRTATYGVAYFEKILKLNRQRFRYASTTLAGVYLLGKSVQLSMCCLSFVLLLKFFQTPSLIMSVDAVRHILAGTNWQMVANFPRITKCDYPKAGPGAPNVEAVHCILPMMIYYEKIFAFLWLWLTILVTLNLLSLLSWLYSFCTSSDNENFVRKRILKEHSRERTRSFQKNSINHHTEIMTDRKDDMITRFVGEYLRLDGCLILRMINQNQEPIFMSYLLTAIFEEFKSNEENVKNDYRGLKDV